MVKDLPRSDAYLKAILSHPTDFKDSIVLDVGCGKVEGLSYGECPTYACSKQGQDS